MRTVAWVLWLCLSVALTGCAQRVDAWVRADAIPGQASLQTQGQTQEQAQEPTQGPTQDRAQAQKPRQTRASYVLLAPPLYGHEPEWEHVRDLLRPALAALGYVPHVAQTRADAATTPREEGAAHRAHTATASRKGRAGASREAGAAARGNAGRDGGTRHMRDTGTPADPSPAPSPETGREGRRPTRGQAAPQPSATPGVYDVPDVVVRVHWDVQGPFQHYVPVLRSAPCWYGPRWHRHWRGYWPHDPFYPHAYVIEDFHVRRLLVEAVRTTGSAPELAAPLTLSNALLREDDSAEPLLWRVLVESPGTLSRAERVLPEMTRAALPWLGRNVRAQVRVRGEDVQVVAAEQ